MWKIIWYHLFPQWEIYKVYQGEWKIEYVPSGLERTSSAAYEIYYSRRLNKYKLKLEGYKPKEHTMYIYVVEQLRQLNDEKSNRIP